MNEIYTEVYRGHTITIEQDMFTPNPVEDWDWYDSTYFRTENNIWLDGEGMPGVEQEFEPLFLEDLDCVWGYTGYGNEQHCVNCRLKKCCVSLDHYRQDNLGHWAEMKALYDFKRDHTYLAVYKYEHSGVAYNTSGFSCPWDSGQVGYVSVKTDQVGTESEAEAYLKNLVKVFHLWASGQVYGYMISGPQCDDSCWGFYAEYEDEEWEYMLEQARSSIDHAHTEMLIEKGELVKKFNDHVGGQHASAG